MSPLSSALDAAEDGTMKMFSLVLDADNEDGDESIIVGTGCSQRRDDEDMFNCIDWGRLMIVAMARADLGSVALEIARFSRVLGSDPKLGTCKILVLEGLGPFGAAPLPCGRCNLSFV